MHYKVWISLVFYFLTEPYFIKPLIPSCCSFPTTSFFFLAAMQYASSFEGQDGQSSLSASAACSLHTVPSRSNFSLLSSTRKEKQDAWEVAGSTPSPLPMGISVPEVASSSSDFHIADADVRSGEPISILVVPDIPTAVEMKTPSETTSLSVVVVTQEAEDFRVEGEDTDKVESFFVAFRRAKWPLWMTLLLTFHVFLTLVAITLLIGSTHWTSPPLALEQLRSSSCPLYLAYVHNTRAPFTMWLPGCPAVSRGTPYVCNTEEDCEAVGIGCAAPSVLQRMTCASSSSDASGMRYCQLRLSLSSSEASPLSSSHPFCVHPTPRCAMCRDAVCADEPIITCVENKQCSSDSPWECV